MRIRSIQAKDVKPTKLVKMSDLSDVVVLAGPNGVGKTRLINALLEHFQGSNPNVSLTIEATTGVEREEWKKDILDTTNPQDAALLRSMLHRSRRRSRWQSSVLNFESNRTITQVSPYQFTWDYQDSFEEEIGWNVGFGTLSSRFGDMLHSIFRKIRSRREAIALQVERLIKERTAALETQEPRNDRTERGAGSDQDTNLSPKIEIDSRDFPDPLSVFKTAFAQLLSPKTLLDPEVQKQQLFYSDGVDQFPITELSSGEREVVNVVFDMLLRNPSDCIVVFDEPELHLHPELSHRLLQTLSG